MFEKLKTKIKYKLMNWLEIERLQKDYKEYIENNDINITDCNNLINSNWKTIEHNFNNLNRRFINTDIHREEQINALNRTLQNVVSIGADICEPYDKNRSWAVVCIEGKHNIVKFIDMQGQDYRYILEFLKQFECSRRVIDAPYKEMFEDSFVWFNDNKR